MSIRSPTDSLTLVERTEIRLVTASHVYRTGRYKKTIFKSMQELNSDFISIEENLVLNSKLDNRCVFENTDNIK